MKRIVGLILVFLLFFTGSCSHKDIQSYQGSEPEFRPERFFDGHVKAWGFSETRFNSINQWFDADFYGMNKGDTLVMHEQLRYSDGRNLERDWTIVRMDEHEYEVEATDMVGTGQGIAYGNTVKWNYYMNVSVGNGKWTMWFDDWMYKQSKNTMIDRATISKYGFTVGQAYIYFRKVSNSIPDEALNKLKTTGPVQ